MKKIYLISMIIVVATCAYADSLTTNYGLIKPSLGSRIWGEGMNTNMDVVDAALKEIYDMADINWASIDEIDLSGIPWEDYLGGGSSTSIDGGSAASTYLVSQSIDGGDANGS